MNEKQEETMTENQMASPRGLIPITVSVTVNAYSDTSSQSWKRTSAAGATVYVDRFSVGPGFVNSGQPEIFTADSDGKVTFSVTPGYYFSVYSKLAGLGASQQFTFLAGETNLEITLLQVPVGVYIMGEFTLTTTTTGWDNIYNGIVISTPDTAFAIPGSLSSEMISWGHYMETVPTLPLTDLSVVENDFNGNQNTAKILAARPYSSAAAYAAQNWLPRGLLDEFVVGHQFFLPSAGQLKLMYVTHKDAINALLKEVKRRGIDVTLLDNEQVWSSTQHNAYSALGIQFFNNVLNIYAFDKRIGFQVRPVSSYFFEYFFS